jgi:hypothetical protein
LDGGVRTMRRNLDAGWKDGSQQSESPAHVDSRVGA